MARTQDEADQIVFRWDGRNASGATGFGPVAWSGDREEAAALFHSAGTVLRASGEEIRPALVRLERRSGVMLIHRTPWTDPGGGASTLCHALVGSADLLDPAVCLGLHAWSWEGADLPLARVRGELSVVRESALLRAVGEGQHALDLRLPHAERELTGAVAELLRRPEGRFTFLDRRGDTALPVLWGLYSLFGELTDRRWTFATHDTAELPALRFVFVGRWAGAASRNTDRHRADPGERAGDEAESLADRLVAHHLRGVAAGGDRVFAAGAALRHAQAGPAAPLRDTVRAALDRLDRRFPPECPSPPPARRGPTPPERPERPAWPERPEPPERLESERPGVPSPPVTSPVFPAVPPQTPAATAPPEVPLPAPDAGPRPYSPPDPMPPVRSAWAGPGTPRRGGRLRRRQVRRTSGLETRLARVREAGEAGEVASEAADTELLAALQDRAHPHAVTTALIQEIARRYPGWGVRLRRGLRDLVIAEEYFVTRSHPRDRVAPAERAADAAALHDWAVRPMLGGRSGGDAPVERLTTVLARFRASRDPVAQGAFRGIVAGERPGLPESVWRALVLDAPESTPTKPAPPRPAPPRPAPPSPAAESPPPTRPTRPTPPAPPVPPAPRPVSETPEPPGPPEPPPPPPRPSGERGEDGRFTFALLAGALVMLVVSVLLLGAIKLYGT